MILFVLVLTSVHWTDQHLTYPINYCQLAAVCVHDHSMVYAATEDGSRRTFLDQCDMYEFNCDFGARFRLICCGDGKLSTLTPTGPDSSTVVPTDRTESDYLVNDIETNSIEKIVENCNPNYKPPCDRPTSWYTTVKEETVFHTPEEPTYAEITEGTIEITTSSSTTSTSTEPTISTEPWTYTEPTTSTESWTYTEPTTSTESWSYTEPKTSTEPWIYTEPKTSTEPTTYTETTTYTEPSTYTTPTEKITWKEPYIRTTTTTTSPPDTTLSTTEKVTAAKTTQTSSTKSHSWWYPKLPCNIVRCERPVTWITTTKKRRRNYRSRY